MTATPAEQDAHPELGHDDGAQTGLAGYLEAMEADDAPVLGYLVLYSVFDGQVTRDDLEDWFAELGLDAGHVPQPIRAVDAFEKITGPAGVRLSYPLPLADGQASPRRRRRPRTGEEGQQQAATLMVRHVRRDSNQIVRHVVREVRNEAETRLSYDTRLAECVFRRDAQPTAAHGAGALDLSIGHAAIQALPDAEQRQVYALLSQLRDAYDRHCTYMTGDRLRGMLRTYIEGLNAIRVRPTGGVYFVHGRHARTLAALRELVQRFGAGSHLARVPLPDQEEMREMVIAAFTTRAREDLDKLAHDIAAAQQDGSTGQAAIQALHKRFTTLQAAAAEHAQLLGTSLDDTGAALKLVNVQLASLLTQAG
jgi:hypothetical protein